MRWLDIGMIPIFPWRRKWDAQNWTPGLSIMVPDYDPLKNDILKAEETYLLCRDPVAHTYLNLPNF